MIVDELIVEEVARQDALLGEQVAVPDDRWMELTEKHFRDLTWANRTRAELENHTIEKEQVQLLAVLYRWMRAANPDA
jgi:hypothetical protein